MEEYTRQIISEKARERWADPIFKEMARQAMIKSSADRKLAGRFHGGRIDPLTDEQRQIWVELHKERGIGTYGLHHTEDTKRKIGYANSASMRSWCKDPRHIEVRKGLMALAAPKISKTIKSQWDSMPRSLRSRCYWYMGHRQPDVPMGIGISVSGIFVRMVNVDLSREKCYHIEGAMTGAP